ncbi:MAG: BTAD domain-containing putative transcriptional regulator [Pseudomonadota bacterium]
MGSQHLHTNVDVTLSVSVLGGFSITDQSKTLIPIANKKACALLAYLLFKPDGAETRERIAGLLWSERSEEQARASLRQSLKQLRVTFDKIGFDGLSAHRNEVLLQRSLIKLDIREILNSFEVGELPDVRMGVDAVPEKLLYGLESLDSSFNSWIQVTRQNWHDRFVSVLQSAMRNQDFQFEVRKLAASTLAKMDPSHEESQRHLMHCHMLENNTGAALRQYSNLWDYLDDEFDMEPEEQTQDLVVQIKSGTYELEKNFDSSEQIPPNLAPVSSIQPVYPLLRIQPFTSAGSNEEDQLAVEVFRQELIAGLVRFREWIIVDGKHISAEGHSGTGESESPQYLVEGIYHLVPGSLNLIVTVKSAIDGRYLWSEKLELSPENWFINQRVFVTRIASGLSICLTAKEVTNRLVVQELGEDVYNDWVNAQRYTWTWTPDGRLKARELYNRIIEHCPTFAPAYSGAASLINSEQVTNPGVFPNKEKLLEGNKLAKKAVALDPLDVRNQAALAWSNGMCGLYDQAENHHRIAQELNPNNPTTLISSANGLAYCGDVENAYEVSRNVEASIPTIGAPEWGYLASTYFICGDYDRSISCAEKSDGALPVARGWHVAALGQQGRTDEAKEVADQFYSFANGIWRGEVECDGDRVVDWFLSHCPVRNKEPLEKARNGFEKAGLATPLKGVTGRRG